MEKRIITNMDIGGTESYDAVNREEARLRLPILSDVNCLNFILAAVTLAAYGILSAVL